MESLLLQDLDSSKISFFEDKSIFWIKTYKYYNSGGYKYIYTNNIVKLLISYILIVIVNFLLNCVNYNKLLALDSHDNNLYDFIDINDWFPKNIYLLFCFIIYSIYMVCITIDCIVTIITYRKFRHIMNDFYGIHDNKIKYMTWEQLIDVIVERNDEHAEMLSVNDNIDMNALNIYEENLYTLNSILCRQGNIMISIFRSKVFTMPRISKLLEWNFIYCIVDPLMNIKGTDLTESINDQSHTTISDKELNNSYSYANAISGSISDIISLDIFKGDNHENEEEKERLLNPETLLGNNNSTLLREIDFDIVDF